MKLMMKHRSLYSIDYDVYDESDNMVFIVQQRSLSLADRETLRVCDCNGIGIGMVKEAALGFGGKYEIYVGGNCVDGLKRDSSAWQTELNFSLARHAWNGFRDLQGCKIWDQAGQLIITSSRQTALLFSQYEFIIDVVHPEHRLLAVMIEIASWYM